MTTFEEAKAIYTKLNEALDAASAKLKVYPTTGLFGMAPEEIRCDPNSQYRKDCQAFQSAHNSLATFNKKYFKVFKKEIMAERKIRNAEREARFSQIDA